MKDWVGANLFFICLALVAAGVLWGGFHLTRWLGFDADAERYVHVLFAIAAIVIAGIAGKVFIGAIERRRR